LSQVNVVQSLNGFNFNNHFSFHPYIQPVSAIQPDIVVNKRQSDLDFGKNSNFVWFKIQTSLVGALQQSWPQLLMNPEGSF
jgi:hypothetical protein